MSNLRQLAEAEVAREILGNIDHCRLIGHVDENDNPCYTLMASRRGGAWCSVYQDNLYGEEPQFFVRVGYRHKELLAGYYGEPAALLHSLISTTGKQLVAADESRRWAIAEHGLPKRRWKR